MEKNKMQTSAAKAAVDSHFSAFKSLILSDFVKNFISVATAQNVMKSLPTVFWRALDKTQERVRRGSESIVQELDIFVRLVQLAANRKNTYVSTIMVETKTHLKDLVTERKMSDYLGAANFSFFSVPQVLILQAFEHIEMVYPRIRHYIGICCYDTGEIICMPQMIKTDNDRSAHILKKFGTSEKVLPGADQIYSENTIHVCDDDASDFEEFQGYQINDKYLPFIRDWYFCNNKR